MTEYQFRDGARISGVSPAVVAKELAVIKKRGDLTAEGVREAARPETAPLHPAVFDKNVEDAAEEYYLNRARQVIRCVIEVPNNAPRHSVYVHVKQPGSRSGKYEVLATIADAPDEFALALGDAERRLQAAQDAVNELLEVAQRVKPVDWSGVVVVASQALTTAREAVASLRAS